MFFSVAFLFVFYFIPTLVAIGLKNKNVVVLFILNLLLGWTILGWICLLIYPFLYTEKWKVKWNEKYIKPKKEPINLEDNIKKFKKFHEETNNFMKDDFSR